MTDFSPTTPQLPSQLTAFANLTATHLAAVIAGGLVGVGAMQSSAQAAAVPMIAGLLLWVAGQGYAYISQHFRHKTAVAAVAEAKAN